MRAEQETESRLELAKSLLTSIWGYQTFNHGQLESISAWAAGRDVVTLLPTGGGKSLCYQIPAMVERKLTGKSTLVVSPLIALMQDQVDSLRAQGIQAASLQSQKTSQEQYQIEEAFAAGLIDILYVSPERAAQSRFRGVLQRSSIGLIAIDEAHCVSQWGHDFRPDYMHLSHLREPSPCPIVAVTATATPRVVVEIQKHLQLESPVFVRGNFARENLSFRVTHMRAQNARSAVIMQELERLDYRDTTKPQRCIIYCSTRKRTEAIAHELRAANFRVAYYHGGRSADDRLKIQRAFEMSRVRVLVATNAFGMGVDYPDVRLIVHAQAPGSLEAYYQEAGRASRDGQPGICLLFFSPGDMMTQRRLASGQQGSGRVDTAIRALELYASTTRCRQHVLVEHFAGDSSIPECGVCDVCDESASALENETAPQSPLSESEQATILSAVGGLTRPVGKSALTKALRGSMAKTLNKYGLLDIDEHGTLRHLTERSIVAAIQDLLDQGKLVRKGAKYPTLWLPGKSVRTRFPRSSSSDSANNSASPKEYIARRPRKQTGSNLRRALELYRSRQAKKLSWKPYMVLHNKVIDELDTNRPRSMDDLNQIHGLGPQKIERFGYEILKIVRDYDQPTS